MVKDHMFQICLDAPLYMKVLEFQVKNKLGKSYASLLIFIEGLKALGLIDLELYEFYRKRYTKPLETNPIVKEPVKCDWCNNPAVGFAVHEKGITKRLCEKHLKLVSENPKWSVMK